MNNNFINGKIFALKSDLNPQKIYIGSTICHLDYVMQHFESLYKNKERIAPQMKVKINVGIKIPIVIVGGRPIIKNKAITANNVMTTKEYIPEPTCHHIRYER